jgi:hypothetical protein
MSTPQSKPKGAQKPQDKKTANAKQEPANKQAAKQTTGNKPMANKQADKKHTPKQDVKEEVKKEEVKKVVAKKEVKKDGAKSDKPSDGYPNDETRSAKLDFNVRLVRTWMINYYKSQNQVARLNHAYIALTAVNQALLTHILNTVKKHLPKEKSDLYDISKASISYAVQLHPDLREMFLSSINDFKSINNYTSSYCIPKSAIAKLVEKVLGMNVKMDESGYNFMAHLLNNYTSLIASKAFNLMEYAKQKSLGNKSILKAVSMFSPSDVGHVLKMAMESAISGFDASNPVKEDGEQVADAAEGDATTAEADEAEEAEEVEEEDGEDVEGAEEEEEVEAEAEAEPVQEKKVEQKKPVKKQTK